MFDNKQFYNLKKRILIKISGKDRFTFFQGIISNDVYHLENNPSIYAAILTPQGRFITDFFLTNYQNSFLMEIESKYEELILQKLNMYKLRSEVELSTLKDTNIFITSNKSIYNVNELSLNNLNFDDPRFKKFFNRLYIFDHQDFVKIKSISDKTYNNLRLKHAVPDFNIDATHNKSLLMEMRFDELNGVSWDKGCYMGQEITARMKYRNLMKRKIFKIEIEFNREIKKEIYSDNEVVGYITSYNTDFGLAYFDLKNIDSYFNKKLVSGDSIITPTDVWWSKS